MGVVRKQTRRFTAPDGSCAGRPKDPGRIRRILSDQGGAGPQPPLFDFEGETLERQSRMKYTIP
jgi:hypothetical protein